MTILKRIFYRGSFRRQKALHDYIKRLNKHYGNADLRRFGEIEMTDRITVLKGMDDEM